MKLILHDVGLRDGLQIEKSVVPTATKLEWFRQLVASGVDMIQVGSFVHAGKVPQMADTDRLFEALRSEPSAPAAPTLTALVLNEKGLERGLSVGVRYFCMGVSASDTHSRKNTGMSTQEATSRILAMAKRAQEEGCGVQLSVQSAFGCGFEGVIPEKKVLDLASRYLEAGFRTISLADTAGHAHPAQVEHLFGALLALDPRLECACHMHNTYGLGLANTYAAIRVGVTVIEAAFAGLGGCPFTAVTGGNVATEDVVHLVQKMGLRKDIALAPLLQLAGQVAGHLGRVLPGTIHRTGPIPDVASPIVAQA